MIAKKRIELRSWRVAEASPSGLFVWFDPARESVELYELDPQRPLGVADALERDEPNGPSGRDQVNELGIPELPF